MKTEYTSENKSKNKNSMLNRALYENEKTEEFPFYLVYSDPTGLFCPKCHWTLYCMGCEIPKNDDLIPYENVKFISVQWKVMPYFLKWSAVLHHSRIIDPSIQKLYQENPLHTISLEKCFENAVMFETLDTQVTCGKCEVKSYMDKAILFTRLPDTFIINLKRFICSNNVYVKNKSSIKFPLDNFDVSPYMADGHPGAIYECIGFVIHKGEIHGGHYVCYCKRDGDWWFINDEDVRKVEECDIDQSDAYTIVYQTKTPIQDIHNGAEHRQRQHQHQENGKEIEKQENEEGFEKQEQLIFESAKEIPMDAV